VVTADNRDELVLDEDIAIRRMRDDPKDYGLLARWLTDERVLEFYNGRDDPRPYERVLRRYRPRVRGQEPVRPCIIEREGRAIGFIQYYPVGHHKDYDLANATGTYGADMFIGEPELWGQGIGARALAGLVAYIFQELDCRRVVLDPHVTNLRAIRSYEKAGFRKVKVLPRHELHEGARRDCWLMATDRSAHDEGHG
jgi:aminoglycoside 6'-N-acetyltransferase